MGRYLTTTILLLLLACSTTAAGSGRYACQPTEERENGPFYRPNAPERSSVGEGYRLRGRVRSAVDCRPLPGARLEFWLAGPDGYTDRYRATVIAGRDGSYRFSSPFPKDYGGTPHIHIRATAPGFQELYTQHYPKRGTTRASFDLTLVPAPQQK